MNPGDTSPSFVILFTDLSIILLTFLIFLNALALPNIERRVNAIASVGEQFKGTKSVQGMGSKRSEGYAPELAKRPGAMSFAERYGSIASIAEKGGVQATAAEDSFLLTIDSDELFTKRDTQISAASLPFLRELVQEFGRVPLKAFIATHTASDGEGYQQSIREAAALARFFLDQGVPSDRLEIRAQGSKHPRASNENNEQISNHRVEILLQENSSR